MLWPFLAALAVMAIASHKPPAKRYKSRYKPRQQQGPKKAALKISKKQRADLLLQAVIADYDISGQGCIRVGVTQKKHLKLPLAPAKELAQLMQARQEKATGASWNMGDMLDLLEYGQHIKVTRVIK